MATNDFRTAIIKLKQLSNELSPNFQRDYDLFDPRKFGSFYDRFEKQRLVVVNKYPDEFEDCVSLEKAITRGREFEGRGYYSLGTMQELYQAIWRILNLAENLGLDGTPGHVDAVNPEIQNTIFLTHGHSSLWRELDSFLRDDLGLKTVELERVAYEGRSTLVKLEDTAKKCGYAIIVMTGDDAVGETELRARENVVYETGYFHRAYGLGRVVVLFEKGTSLPSNLDGHGRVQFTKGHFKESFPDLHRELRATKIIK